MIKKPNKIEIKIMCFQNLRPGINIVLTNNIISAVVCIK